MAHVRLDSLTVRGCIKVRVFFWVVMPCGLLGGYERLEHIDLMFSVDVSIEGVWQIVQPDKESFCPG
jgi:hypothetical protein